MCPLPDYTRYIVVPLPVDSGEHARTVSDLIKRSEYYSPNQFLSFLAGFMHTTPFKYPQRKKSRGVRSGDLAGHAKGPPLPIHFSL